MTGIGDSSKTFRKKSLIALRSRPIAKEKYPGVMTMAWLAPAAAASLVTWMVVWADPAPVPTRSGSLTKPASSRAFRTTIVHCLRSSGER